MSGFLSSLATWRANLRPGSWRGVGFYIDEGGLEGGRRNAKFEFPDRDTPWVEDMGRRARLYRVRAYVLGDDYMASRDAMLDACETPNTTGTLVHPYLGTLTVRLDTYHMAESDREGGIARFDLVFLEPGTQPSPIVSPATASTLLQRLGSLVSVLINAFVLGYTIATHPGYLLGIAEGLLGSVAASLLHNVFGLSPGALVQLANVVNAITAGGSDASGTATAITAAFSAAADAVVTALPVAGITYDPTTGNPVSAVAYDPATGLPTASVTYDPATGLPVATGPYDPVMGDPGIPVISRDPSYGLAALATWGSTLPAVTGTTPALLQQAANQTALVLLVQGSAVMAVATVYANTAWISAQAAEAAAQQLACMIDAQATAAADSEQTALYLAWQAVGAAINADMTARAQNLPELTEYATPASLPALVLAQRLCADASRATQLVMLNDAPHPAFMPAVGVALAS